MSKITQISIPPSKKKKTKTAAKKKAELELSSSGRKDLKKWRGLLSHRNGMDEGREIRIVKGIQGHLIEKTYG